MNTLLPLCGPTDHVPQEARTLLRTAGGLPDDEIPLGACALALGALDRPGVGLDRYHDHLDSLVAETVAEAERAGIGADDAPESVAGALRTVLCGRYRYAGDAQSYDNLQNANLLRVIDRRRGLPVALGILFIHAARGMGCRAAGLNFPGHFVVRLESGGQRLIIDPFNGGQPIEARGLREMLKAMAGNDAELDPGLVTAVGDRQILLRLQNNIKMRHLRLGHLEKALRTVDRMLLFAPEQTDLWREAGIIDVRLGNLLSAVDRLEHYLDTATDERGRYRTTMLIQELRNRLN